MRWPWETCLNLVCSTVISLTAFMLAAFESSSQLLAVFLHRFFVATREVTGQSPFEPLAKAPRHVCLVIGRPAKVNDVDKAVRIILSVGIERVTVCHDGSLALSSEMYTECVTKDMGKSAVVESIRTGYPRVEELSQPDAVLILGSNGCPTRFSLTALQLPKCTDASFLYYSELLPVFSLHPSDVYLAVSMFQSKSQRFGR
jgi:hypothetical protein